MASTVSGAGGRRNASKRGRLPPAPSGSSTATISYPAAAETAPPRRNRPLRSGTALDRRHVRGGAVRVEQVEDRGGPAGEPEFELHVERPHAPAGRRGARRRRRPAHRPSVAGSAPLQPHAPIARTTQHATPHDRAAKAERVSFMSFMSLRPHARPADAGFERRRLGSNGPRLKARATSRGSRTIPCSPRPSPW